MNTELDQHIEDPDSMSTAPEDLSQLTIPLQLSYNALTGLPARGSIHFSGTVQGRDIRVLMDGGSSDSFIHPALVKQLALPWYKIPPFKVQVGSGELLTCEGQVRNVPLQIQHHTITVIAFVLPIASEELVLGDIWLETLDTHLVNYKKFITFLHNDQLITLQGDLQPVIDQAQFHQFRRLQTTNTILGLYTLQIQPQQEFSLHPAELQPHIDPELALLLQNYQDVFQLPHGLPPPRVHDHAIHLLPNTAPIKVKPYKYPHCQKDEIEKLVSDMLAEGVIQPSTSPFSSPILLVKKKMIHGDSGMTIGP